MTEPTPDEGIDLCVRWEGWHKALPDGRAAPYKCPAGVWTIGFGTTYWMDDRPVRPSDDAITREVGRQLLLRQLIRYATAVDRAIKVRIHPWMRAACVSLCYNIGTSAFAKSSVVRLINQRRWSEVPRAFQLWRNGGGRVLTGLLNRRIDESALFMRGVAQLAAAPVAATAPSATIIDLPVRAPGAPAAPSWWRRILEGVLEGLNGPAVPA
jgi:lysozyme